MKPKFFLPLLILLLIGSAAKSQSVFYMNYRFTSIQDTTLYHIFLVRYDDGTGFYRVRFYDDVSKTDMLVDLDMEEKYFIEKDGSINYSKLYFKGSNPQIMAGDKTYKYYPEIFWFMLDKRSGVYEPWAVTSPDEKGVAQGMFVDPPELIDQKDLTKDFVSIFFFEDEGFYQNLFDEAKQRGLTPTQKASTKIYHISVANTEDDDIGASCLKDQGRNVKTFSTLAEYMGLQIITKTIDGKDFSRDNINKAVQALNPSANDIVIFTYSGHGFTIPKENRKFPNLDLRSSPSQSYLDYYLNIEDIYNSIRKKGARFNLIISDCCNNDPNSSNSVGSDIAQTRSSGLGWSMENCRTLFMNNKPMSILMSSADVGEKASGNITFGGFFSYYFKVAMENNFSSFKSNVTWDDIIADARKQTTEKAELTYCDKPYIPSNICKQHPIYKIMYQ